MPQLNSYYTYCKKIKLTYSWRRLLAYTYKENCNSSEGRVEDEEVEGDAKFSK